MSIKSKIFNYGSEHESEWPPRFPQDTSGGCFYWCKETQTFKEGYPPDPNPKYDTAPSVIFDSMEPTYHEGACRTVESRKEWQRLDKETGSITFGSVSEPRKYIEQGQKEKAKELDKDRESSIIKAMQAVRQNPKEIRQKLEKQAEKQDETARKSGLKKLLKEKGVL